MKWSIIFIILFVLYTVLLFLLFTFFAPRFFFYFSLFLWIYCYEWTMNEWIIYWMNSFWMQIYLAQYRLFKTLKEQTRSSFTNSIPAALSNSPQYWGAEKIVTHFRFAQNSYPKKYYWEISSDIYVNYFILFFLIFTCFSM